MSQLDTYESKGEAARADSTTVLRRAIAVAPRTGQGLTVIYADGTTAYVPRPVIREPANFRREGRA